MVAFIDDHKAEYGVEPICRVLPIAPSTYYWHKAQEVDPGVRSARAQQWDNNARRQAHERILDLRRMEFCAKRLLPARASGTFEMNVSS
jgi:hypothetical protein